jgi:hypothetical protein
MAPSHKREIVDISQCLVEIRVMILNVTHIGYTAGPQLLCATCSSLFSLISNLYFKVLKKFETKF